MPLLFRAACWSLRVVHSDSTINTLQEHAEEAVSRFVLSSLCGRPVAERLVPQLSTEATPRPHLARGAPHDDIGTV